MEYAQFSKEHMMDCMEKQSMLIDIFYKELKVKRRLKKEKALLNQLRKKASQTQTINIK